MNRHNNAIIFGSALFAAGVAATSLPAFAQTFQNYRCADGSQFIVGFFEYDKRAHMQIDGRAVTLGKRFALSGALFGRRRHVENHEERHHAQARQTTDHGVRTDMKKGPKRFRSDPLSAFDIVPKTSNASASSVRLASVLPHRLGLLDCRFVIPAAAARSFAHGRGSKIGSGLAFLVATLAESRATPGRELVDLCGPVIQTRIHYRLS